jgi:hypothetical protein
LKEALEKVVELSNKIPITANQRVRQEAVRVMLLEAVSQPEHKAPVAAVAALLTIEGEILSITSMVEPEQAGDLARELRRMAKRITEFGRKRRVVFLAAKTSLVSLLTAVDSVAFPALAVIH